MNLTTTPIAIAALGLMTAVAGAQTRVQILHASDLEGGVDAVQDAPNFAAVVEALEADAQSGAIPSLLLSAGDNYIPGPFFSAAGDFTLRNTFRTVLGQPDAREGEGRVDVSIMNLLGFDASAVGNHEFDAGTGAFASIIGTDIRNNFTEARWLGAQFPYLSTNLDFSNSSLAGLYTAQILPNTDFQGDLADLVAAANAPKLAPATTVTRGGQTFGIVGATTPLVESISSTGGVTVNNPGAGTNDMAALASLIQPSIDALTNQGIDKIILVSHLQQFALEQQLVSLLSGVDIVIAGGSDTLLADAGDRLRAGDVAQGNYPTVATNGDGDPALLLSTDGQYSYVGRLVVDFDANGVVDPNSVVAAESGAYATDNQGVIDLFGNLVDPFLAGTDAAAVKTLTDAVSAIVIARDANIVGRADVFLEGRRTPIRTEETNMGNLTADANLFVARQFDPTVLVSHKNGGGIRNPIGSIGQNGELGPNEANPLSGKQAGEVSQLDVENALRFNNGLALQTLSRQQFKDVLEHAVAGSGPGSTPGQFGQWAGVSFSFDVSLPAGSRVRYAALTDATSEAVVVQNGAVVGSQPIRIVTLDFLAGGGDGYPFDTFAAADPVFADFVELETAGLPAGAATFAAAGSEQDAFAEYMLANFAASAFGAADRTVAADQRVQQIGTRPGFTVVQNQTTSRDYAVTAAAPFAFGFVSVGLRAGTTSFDLGLLGMLDNGVETLLIEPLGLTDGNGSLVGSWPAPFNGTVGLVGQVQLLSLGSTGFAAASTESVAFDL
ncbi:MAG: bifunctional metallophosphatase/5'-nucleotidase [Planctomycetota bacterium]